MAGERDGRLKGGEKVRGKEDKEKEGKGGNWRRKEVGFSPSANISAGRLPMSSNVIQSVSQYLHVCITTCR